MTRDRFTPDIRFADEKFFKFLEIHKTPDMFLKFER
jgi:hypothetical protein